MGKYDGERFDPKVNQCSPSKSIQLEFDGKTLTMTSGSTVTTYSAVSGKADGNGSFDYSADRQKKSNEGPIPAGKYWVNPSEMWVNAWYKRGSYDSWGNYRITIHPYKSTATHGRGGFFIHGGKTPGSIGCIDLSKSMNSFVSDLATNLTGNKQFGPDWWREAMVATHNCHIHLEVNY